MNRVPRLRRKAVVLVGVLGMLVLAGYVSWVRLTEPRYEGKPASYWFSSYCDLVAKHNIAAMNSSPYVGPLIINDMAADRQAPAITALRALGDPAIAFLCKRVVSRMLGSASVYGRAHAKLPPGIRRVLPNPLQRDSERFQAVVALSFVGAKGEPASSVVIRYILEQPPGSYFCSRAIDLLPELQPSPGQMDELTTALFRRGRFSDMKAVVDRFRLRSPVVVKCVGDLLEKEGITNIWSFLTLRAIGERASPIVPLLLRLLTSTNREMRYQCVRTFETIGPAAAEAIPALNGCLSDESVMLQSAARRAISAILESPPPKHQ